MDGFDHQEFFKIRDKADAFYKNLGKIRCRALEADVHFTSDGFHHLRFDGTRAERAKNVQRTKLLCLEEAADVVRRSSTIQEYRCALQPIGKPDLQGLRVTKKVEYFGLTAITDIVKLRRVNVVIRRVGDGNYHFWSVMPQWKETKVNGGPAVRSIGGRWLFD